VCECVCGCTDMLLHVCAIGAHRGGVHVCAHAHIIRQPYVGVQPPPTVVAVLTFGAIASFAPFSIGTEGAFCLAAAAGKDVFLAISSFRKFIISCILPRGRGAHMGRVNAAQHMLQRAQHKIKQATHISGGGQILLQEGAAALLQCCSSCSLRLPASAPSCCKTDCFLEKIQSSCLPQLPAAAKQTVSWKKVSHRLAGFQVRIAGSAVQQSAAHARTHCTTACLHSLSLNLAHSAKVSAEVG